jgi:uncharacterized membrane protein
MAEQRATPERLGAFSDGVFAVIITIMVLDLRPPSGATLAALLPLWPAALSYAVSYLFIAIVWVNHHHLLRFAEHATPRLIWVNFAHLFMVSLVPFSTAWVGAGCSPTGCCINRSTKSTAGEGLNMIAVSVSLMTVRVVHGGSACLNQNDLKF